MTIKRRCSNCHQLYEGLKCPTCSKKLAVQSSQRRFQEDEGRKLYSSRAWAKCRSNIRVHYLDYDIWLYAIGIKRVCQKPYLHHIIPRDEAPELTFDTDNLVTVSKESHEEIHKWYQDPATRAEAVARLRKGINDFDGDIYGY